MKLFFQMQILISFGLGRDDKIWLLMMLLSARIFDTLMMLRLESSSPSSSYKFNVYLVTSKLSRSKRWTPMKNRMKLNKSEQQKLLRTVSSKQSTNNENSITNVSRLWTNCFYLQTDTMMMTWNESRQNDVCNFISALNRFTDDSLCICMKLLRSNFIETLFFYFATLREIVKSKSCNAFSSLGFEQCYQTQDQTRSIKQGSNFI